MSDSPKMRQLKEVLGRLSREEADRLIVAVERDKLASGRMPHELILDALRPKLKETPAASRKRGGAPTPVRHLCWPFEELLVNERDGPKHRGRIPRTSIMPVWTWLAEDRLPDTLPKISERIVEHTLAKDDEALAATVGVLHASCTGAIRAGIEEAPPGSHARRLLVERLGGEAILEDAREMALLLEVSPQLSVFKEGMPRNVAELTPEIAGQVRDLFDELVATQPDAAPYAAVIAMRRIEKPWQMFRIVKGVAHTNTDVLVSRTDISIVGELLLLDMEGAVDRMETIDPGEDPDAVVDALRRFTQISRGITEEIGIRRDGAWATRLMSARGAVSEIIRDRLERASAVIVKALPMRTAGRFGRGGPSRPDLSHPADPARVARAHKTLLFLQNARRYAQPGSFTGAHNAASTEIDRYLDDYERGILEELRCEDAAIRARAETCLDAVADMVDVFRGPEEASLLRRRGMVAANAAAV